MFRRLASICAVFVALIAAGCGGSGRDINPTSPNPPQPAPSPTPPGTVITPAGPNWSFWPVDLSSGSGLVGLEGSFDASGTAVTAVLAPFGSCFNPDQDRFQFTGTRSGRSIEMRSQTLNGHVLDLSGTLSVPGDAFEGTFTLTGQCSGGGDAIGRAVDLTGVWTGTMEQIPTTIDLQMEATPDGSAGYPVSGTVQFSNTQCFRNATIARRVRGRWLFPDIVAGGQRLELLGTVSQDLRTMEFEFVLVEGACPELSSGIGRLTRQ